LLAGSCIVYLTLGILLIEYTMRVCIFCVRNRYYLIVQNLLFLQLALCVNFH
jgi:hypothetical protein